MSLNYLYKFTNSRALVAASLTLAGAAFAQVPPDSSMPGGPNSNFVPGPGVNGQNFQNNPGMGMNQGNGPWGGGGRRHMRRLGQGMGPGGGPGGTGARRQKMMQRFDANGDGQLDSVEQAQLQQFKEQRRAQREAQGGGQGFNGPQGQGMPPGDGMQMGQGQGMGPGGMNGRGRGMGMRGGKRRWHQNFNQNSPMQQGFAPGPGSGQGPAPNELIPPQGGPSGSNQNGIGQIQPFQNIPQNPSQ